MIIHLNLGSNLGNRLGNINRAIAFLIESDKIVKGSIRVSQPFESDAWGYVTEHRYINVGLSMTLNAEMKPRELIEWLQDIQELVNRKTPHRDKDGYYIDRLLDIDVIAIGEKTIDVEELVVPHPRMHLREFVLCPMAELEPGWIHPVFKKNIFELLEDLHKI